MALLFIGAPLLMKEEEVPGFTSALLWSLVVGSAWQLQRHGIKDSGFLNSFESDKSSSGWSEQQQ